MDMPGNQLFRLDRARLLGLASQHRVDFADADPFPHIVLKDFLPDDVARALAAEFPPIRDDGWCFAGPGHSVNTGDINIEKVQNDREEFFPPLIRRVMHEFNSSTFLDFLGELTGYTGLLSDPWFAGCGLHSTGRGGRLMIHADQDRHPNQKLHQVINAIYYVSQNWQSDWGGQLELWDRDAKTRVKSVEPTFNSLVIFYTGRRSYHGHPHPLQTPEGVRRNSLAAYYYTTDRQISDDYEGRIPHVVWKSTNEHDQLTMKGKIWNGALRIMPERAVYKLARIWGAIKE